MRLRTTLTVLLAFVLVALIAGVALATSPTSAGRSRGTIVFLGDSNEVFPAAEIDIALLNRDNGYIVVNVARPGSTIRYGDCPASVTHCSTNNYWQARISDLTAAVHPDVYVIDLGINDTAYLGTSTTTGYAAYGTKIDWLVNQLGNTPIAWTNLPCKAEPPARLKGCQAVNAALSAAQSRHANLHLLDWGTVANQHPNYVGAPPGAVHLTPAGNVAYAQLVAKRLDAMFKVPS